jgi:addiction module HigA family antidote
MLLEEFIKPLGMTQAELADRIGVSYVRLNEIVNGRRGITPSTALRLAKAFSTSPQFWLNGQLIRGHSYNVCAGRGRWRTVVNAGQHCWKACWGQPRSSNLPSCATLACDDAIGSCSRAALHPSACLNERGRRT